MKIKFKFILLLFAILLTISYFISHKDFQLEKEVKYAISNIYSDKPKISSDKNILLVNKKNGLDENYIPKDLSIPNIEFVNDITDEEKHVSSEIIKPLEELVKAAQKDGIILIGNSGYRSYNTQERLYSDRVKSDGKKAADKYVSKPGYSEHQTGLCIDITNQGKYFVEGTEEAAWLMENSYKFGFIIRYPKGKSYETGVSFEPWHIRYVGESVAKYIYENKLSLEEYLKGL